MAQQQPRTMMYAPMDAPYGGGPTYAPTPSYGSLPPQMDVKPRARSLSPRATFILTGVFLLLLLIVVPVWNAFALLQDRNYTFWCGPSVPTWMIILCFSVVVLYALTVWLFFGSARPQVQTEQTVMMIANIFITLLGLVLMLVSLPLSQQSVYTYNNLMHRCDYSEQTHRMYEYANLLHHIRAKPECAAQFSVASCAGYQEAAPYTTFLKQLENNFRCSGFCYQPKDDSWKASTLSNVSIGAEPGSAPVNPGSSAKKGKPEGKVKDETPGSLQAASKATAVAPASAGTASAVPAAVPAAVAEKVAPAAVKDVPAVADTGSAGKSAASAAIAGGGMNAGPAPDVQRDNARDAGPAPNVQPTASLRQSQPASPYQPKENALVTLRHHIDHVTPLALLQVQEPVVGPSDASRLAAAMKPIPAYPPTLFSDSNFQASCEGMAARDMKNFAGDISYQTFFQGIYLVLIAIATGFLKLIGFCVRREHDVSYHDQKQ